MKCTVCDKETTKVCSLCKVSYYCSKECQVADRSKNHKYFCGMSFPKRDPNKKTVFGFLLQEKGDIKIVNVRIDEKKGQGRAAVIAPFLEYPNDKTTRSEIFSPFTKYFLPRKLFEPKNLKNMLQFSYRKNFLNDGSQSNECVKKLTANKNSYDWKGPILLLKIKGIENYGNLTYIL